MPSPKHPCAHPSCNTLITAGFVHCRKHHVKTPDHVAKIALANRGKTISEEARKKIGAANSGDGSIHRVCQYCGKSFDTYKPSSRVRFCSRDCGYKNRIGENAKNWIADMPVYVCKICGKETRTPARKLPRPTCSRTCSAIWKKSTQRNRGTNIEVAMEKALIERGLNYQSQVALCGVTIADFFLPETKTVIFCDGDYWHGLPERQERDDRQSKILRECGYIVYRFLGSVILDNPDKCLDKIKHL